MSDQENAKRFWTRRKKRFFAVLLGLVVLYAGYYRYRDRPMKLVQTTDVERLADPKTGEVVDYHFAYDALQNEALTPVEENGWRLILQTFGPLALDNYYAERVPWEEFPTNKETKEWFDGDWTYLCEKFKLDPYAKPTALGRLSLWDYLGKYGLKGDEPEPDFDPIPDSISEFCKFRGPTYWENYEERPAKGIVYSEVLNALSSKPWTAEEYPVPARWFDENADLFETLAQAARSPRLGCLTLASEDFEGNFDYMQFSPEFGICDFCQIILARACYRVGSRDISGAIDDVETVALFARSILNSGYAGFSSGLMGTARLFRALRVPLYGNPDVPPTSEELARVAALWRSFYQDGQMTRYFRLALRGQKLARGYGIYADYLTLRRRGRPIYRELTGCDSVFNGEVNYSIWERALYWLIFCAPPIDDAKSLRFFQEIFDATLEMSDDEIDDYLDVGEFMSFKGFFLALTSPERIHASWVANYGYVIPSWQVAKDVYFFSELALKEATIASAFVAYYREHGTLPPAFTVDEKGKPLHSWRVLILPYLGDEERALYDQIRLDEPWDSEHNAAFHAQTPDVFRRPAASETKEGETIFSVLLGDEGFFDESGVGKDPKEAASDPNHDVWNQFLVVERADPVDWMTPDAELKIADFTADGEANVGKFFENCPTCGKLYYATLGGAVNSVNDSVSAPELEARLLGLPFPEKEERFFLQTFESDDVECGEDEF